MAVLTTEEAVSRVTAPPLRAAVERILQHYLASLGYADDAAGEALIRHLSERLPAGAGPELALRHLRRRLDRWTLNVVRQCRSGPTPDVYTRRAALLAIQPGRDWPDALMAADPPPALLTAFLDALPVATPPEARLAMPAQSLGTAPAAAVESTTPDVLLRRRFAVLGGTAIGTALATLEMGRVFSPGGISAIEVLLMVLFAANFVWIALTFCSALAGLWSGLRPSPLPGLKPGLPASAPLTERTAVLMPTYNEDPLRVLAAIEKIYLGLAAAGALEHFEFFILSDTTDPDCWVAEELAWDACRRRLGATGRLFYRRRFENTGRKAGNIADFCERWGARYENMLVLDADSVMSAETVLTLARQMATNPDVGILQTVPRLVNRNTLFARAQQFAAAMYGPVLARGFGFWYGGDSNYWGHNAIIRAAAFASCAGMPVLPGKAPFGGHILSHDFVEAALMRRAGWRSHLLTELGGSYEESPPSLLDHAMRDRRWCQGNLQHMALLGTAGLHPLSRFHLLSGIMSYLASPLWFLFLLVGIFAALQGSLQLPVYFFPDRTPYPVWQVINPELAARLFGVTMLVLLAPKFFGWIAVAVNRDAVAGFGGRRRALMSVLAETLFSALIAPVQMLLQSQFVFDVLVGRDSGWKTQTRDDRGMPFAECWHRHRAHMVAGVTLGVAAWTVYPALLAWMMPALLGMLIAAPVSWLGARLAVGLKARERGLFIIPEEASPLPLLNEPPASEALIAGSGLARVTHDLPAGSLHLALLAQHPGASELSDAMILARYRASVARKPEELAARFDRRLQAAALTDPVAIRDLRRRLGGFHH